MLYFRLYLLHYSCCLIVSYSYLCICVNPCSIICQVIIYLNMLKCWIFLCWLIASVSTLYLALFSWTFPGAMIVIVMCTSQSFLFWFAQILESLSTWLTCLDRLKLSWFMLHTTSRYSSHSWFVSDFPSQSFLLCFSQHLHSVCSL